MSILDEDKVYKRCDKEDILFGIEHLAKQVRIAWQESREVVLPKRYKEVDRIVVFATGGSSLPAHVIESVFSDRLKLPLTVLHDYQVPAYVNRKTLALVCSFSGNTEEVVTAAKEVRARKTKMLVITTGGKLGRMAKREKLPWYQVTPGELAKQPRLGTGFLLAGMMGLFDRAGVLNVKAREITEMIDAMGDVLDTCARDVKEKQNPAKVVAQELKGKPVMIVAAEHLVGNARVMRNQISETAKQFADLRVLPNLNHYLMEGLTYPKGFFKNYCVLLVRSNHYHGRNQKRFDLTAEVFERLGAQVIDYQANGRTPLEEVGELLQFGAFLSYYMAMLNGVNPIEIPFVDEFKERL
jgi:glucose/mannose-6-phosphate isomerase